jgi:outer membrane protein assembly factor BamB
VKIPSIPASNVRFFADAGLRWQVQTDGAVRSSPAVSGDRIYVGSGDGGLYALDRQSGRQLWRFQAGGAVYASPAVKGGVVVCATLEGRVFAVEQSSGRLRWSFTSGPALPFNTSPAGGWDNLASSPVVVGTSVVIGTPDGLIRAVDLSSGKSLWQVKTGGRVRTPPAVKDGLVVVGSFDGRVYGPGSDDRRRAMGTPDHRRHAGLVEIRLRPEGGAKLGRDRRRDGTGGLAGRWTLRPRRRDRRARWR